MTSNSIWMEPSRHKALREGKDLIGQDGILTPFIQQLTEAAAKTEFDEHLASNETPNRHNGSTSNITKSLVGKFELKTPGDRAGTLEA